MSTPEHAIIVDRHHLRPHRPTGRFQRTPDYMLKLCGVYQGAIAGHVRNLLPRACVRATIASGWPAKAAPPRVVSCLHLQHCVQGLPCFRNLGRLSSVEGEPSVLWQLFTQPPCSSNPPLLLLGVSLGAIPLTSKIVTKPVVRGPEHGGWFPSGGLRVVRRFARGGTRVHGLMTISSVFSYLVGEL